MMPIVHALIGCAVGAFRSWMGPCDAKPWRSPHKLAVYKRSRPTVVACERPNPLGVVGKALGRWREVLVFGNLRLSSPGRANPFPLGLAEPQKTGPAPGQLRTPEPDPGHLARESAVGIAPHPVGIVEARERSGQVDHREISRPPALAVLTDLAGVPEDPRGGDRHAELLHGPDGPVPGAVRSHRAGA
jgi:hypothetical protein